jgi:hypothetical protein
MNNPEEVKREKENKPNKKKERNQVEIKCVEIRIQRLNEGALGLTNGYVTRHEIKRISA